MTEALELPEVLRLEEAFWKKILFTGSLDAFLSRVFECPQRLRLAYDEPKHPCRRLDHAKNSELRKLF